MDSFWLWQYCQTNICYLYLIKKQNFCQYYQIFLGETLLVCIQKRYMEAFCKEPYYLNIQDRDMILLQSIYNITLSIIQY